MGNPTAIDYSDLKYYDAKIKKYIDDKDAQLEASLSAFLEYTDRINALAEDVAVHEEAIKNIREHIDEDEAAILVLQNDDKLIREDIADLRVLVENKLDESAMEYLATKQYVQDQIAKAQISGGDVDLTNYYTKAEVDAKLPNLDNYATRSELEAVQNVAGQNSVKLFAIESEIFDIEKKLEKIPSTEGLASEQFVLDKIDEIVIPTKVSDLDNDAGFITEIPSEYITESELEQKGYLTEHQSLENYATKEFVAESIASINIPDTSKFITMADVEAKGYATEQYVLDHVNTQVEAKVTEVVEKQVTELVQTQVKDEVAEQLAINEKINYGTFGEL